MAKFDPAYSIVRKNEGGYVFNPVDPGGETYAGIARNIYPSWSGWVIVDFEKRTKGPIPINTMLTGLEGKVREFYQQLWDKYRLSEINDQNVANIFFDFIVLHSQAVRAMQEVLRQMGINVSVDNSIGSETINGINAVNSSRLHDLFKAKREAIHTQRVKERPDQLPFLEGWLKRTAKFISQSGKNTIIGIALFAAAVIGTLVYINNN